MMLNSSYTRYNLLFNSIFVLELTLQIICSATQVFNQLEAEDLYESTMLIDKNNSEYSICNYDKHRKMAICEEMFKTQQYKYLFTGNTEILINVTAFYNLDVSCKPQRLSFIHKKYLNEQNIQQDMYSCYGRHNPMLTNWNQDDFFEKVYVSGDSTRNILFVYLKQKSLRSTRTIIFKFYLGIQLNNIHPALPISIHMIQYEIQTLIIPFFSRKLDYLEQVYLQNNSNEVRNTFCELNWIDKILLCQEIFKRKYYVNLNFILNTFYFGKHEPRCDLNYVEFSTSPTHNKKRIQHEMLPCFGTYVNKENYINRNIFLKQFSIAVGPKPNSVFVFSQLGAASKYSISYSIHELIQNFHLKKWNQEENTLPEQEFNEQEAVNVILKRIKSDRYYKEPFREFLPIEKEEIDEKVFLT